MNRVKLFLLLAVLPSLAFSVAVSGVFVDAADTNPAIRFDRRDASSGGQWKGKFGGKAVWIPNVSDAKPQSGYQLQATGTAFTWQDPTDDLRALEWPSEKGPRRVASCWFGPTDVSFEVTPPDNKPYRLTAYVLDFDHDGRTVEAKVSDAVGSPVNLQTVTKDETNRGVYLTWIVSGKVQLVFNRTAGTNVAVSGVFIDAADTAAADTVAATNSAIRFDRRDASAAGQWKGKFGAKAVWIPNVSDAKPQNGYQLQPTGTAFTWQDPTEDPRALEWPSEQGPRRVASCWFGPNDVSFEVTPSDSRPYRLTTYVLDFDHDGRTVEAKVSDAAGSPVNLQTVTKDETNRGVYLTWIVSGKVQLVFNRTAGTNVAVSGVFIDAADANPAETPTSPPR